MKRDLIAVIWSLLVTGAISKWAFHVAYLERGYKAVGGEYLLKMVERKKKRILSRQQRASMKLLQSCREN